MSVRELLGGVLTTGTSRVLLRSYYRYYYRWQSNSTTIQKEDPDRSGTRLCRKVTLIKHDPDGITKIEQRVFTNDTH
jgi:hypothetical protein